MKTNRIIIGGIIIFTALMSAWVVSGERPAVRGDEHGHGHEAAENRGETVNEHDHDEHGGDGHDDHDDEAWGPHGGRLLSRDGFAVEIVIAEAGVPPEFHVHGYSDGKPLDPGTFSAEIRLSRLGGQVDTFRFVPVGDYLRGDGVVREPHSFDVEVMASYEGVDYDWAYESHEGRTTIPDNVVTESGVGVAIAGPAVIVNTLELTGTVQAEPSKISEVRARFPGVVQRILHDIGDEVRAGAVLAVVESNESLRRYNVTAPIGGLIVDRNLQVGQVAANEPLYRIVDLSTVWVQLDVLGRSSARIAAGQPVRIVTLDGHEADGALDWLSPLVAHGSQSQRARVPLPNPLRLLRPGQFVRGIVTTDTTEVPLAVRLSGLQTFRDFDVVYEKLGSTYEVRMLTLGRRDREHVEVLDGLSAGAAYVADNSYLIKADIDKSGAGHDH